MGWTSSSAWQTRKDIIADRIQGSIQSNGTKWLCKAHSLRGNVLWTLWEVTAKGESTTIIGCDLLQKLSEGWAYKDMDESCHPYYYSCPLRYLEAAPVLNQKWRDEVLAYHKRRSFKLREGLIVGLSGCIIDAVQLVEKRKQWIGRSKDGRLFKISKEHLSGDIFQNWPELN